jgi:hypothetical protein
MLSPRRETGLVVYMALALGSTTRMAHKFLQWELMNTHPKVTEVVKGDVLGRIEKHFVPLCWKQAVFLSGPGFYFHTLSDTVGHTAIKKFFFSTSSYSCVISDF